MSVERIWSMHDYSTLDLSINTKQRPFSEIFCVRLYQWHSTVVNCQYETRSTKILVGPLAMQCQCVDLSRYFEGWVKGMVECNSISLRSARCIGSVCMVSVARFVESTSTYRACAEVSMRLPSPIGYTNTTIVDTASYRILVLSYIGTLHRPCHILILI